jgi:hypothetical protein
MADQLAWDYLAAFITIGALAIGLISMAVGWVSDRLDRRRQSYRASPARRIMSRPRSMRRAKRAHASVYIPVSRYGMDTPGMESSTVAAPDMDAPNAGMPRVSRDITTSDEIVLLAVLRAPDGSYRHTANKIYQFVGGDRNSVLEKVREVRAKPVYRPLTPDHRPAELQQA